MTQAGPDQRVLIKRTAKILLRGFSVLLLLVLAGGIYGIWGQWRIDSAYQPTTAHIVAAKIITIKANGFIYYQPQITYQYTVGRKPYTANTLRGHQRGGTRAQAGDMLAHYPLGGSCTAWYDPANPSHAVILRPFSFAPYLMVIVPIMIAMILLWAVRSVLAPLIGQPVNADPAETGDGWFILKPRHSMISEIKFWAIVLLGWLAVLGIVFGQYFAMTGGDYQRLAVISLVAFALLIFVPLAILTRWLVSYWRIDEPVMLINQRRPKMGRTVEVRLTGRLRRDVESLKIELEMSCHRQALFVSDLLRSGSQMVEDIPWRSSDILVQRPAVLTGEQLMGSAAFELPAELEPIPKFKIKPGRVMLRWQARVNIQGNGHPIYQTIYPISVEFVLPRQVAHTEV